MVQTSVWCKTSVSLWKPAVSRKTRLPRFPTHPRDRLRSWPRQACIPAEAVDVAKQRTGTRASSAAASPATTTFAAPPGLSSTDVSLATATAAVSLSTSALPTTAPADLVTPSSVQFQASSNVAEAIVDTATAQTVQAKKRSAISFDTRIRGYQAGQILTVQDGANWIPVRQDLDTILSKVDPYLIGNLNIISGPYGLRYGSGFSFIVLDTVPTFRYENGPESHVRLGSTFRANGDQWYNRATLYGGGEDYGYTFNYGNRTGVDYEAGNGLDIPSSYQAQDFYGSFGIDVNEQTRAEFRFHRLDQTDTEYAAQFFDVDFLGSNGFSASIIRKIDDVGAAIRLDGWLNETTMAGDTDKPGKRLDSFPVLQRVDQALTGQTINPAFFGDVRGYLRNSGLRWGMTFEEGNHSLGFGADARYVQQNIREDYFLPFELAPGNRFSTTLPDSYLVDPGAYIEATLELHEDWIVSSGGRVDFAETGSELGGTNNFGGPGNFPERARDTLLAGYLTNDIQLTSCIDGKFGVGYAERVPDLTDRYSDGLFLAVIQNGFSRVIGTPTLEKERNLQADVRLNGRWEDVRVRLTGFHSWVFDYITYFANTVPDPAGARLLKTTNTDLATLAGADGYMEIDWTESVQTFAAISYLTGRDQTIDQPLAGIVPLESRLGIRFLDPEPENRWGFEFGARIVDNQDRLSAVRPQFPATDFVLLEQETPGFTTFYFKTYF
ncbi:MAG: TonB-dependent receptor, partial [Pirellulaceae bacterium]